jgi:hypothetical protein
MCEYDLLCVRPSCSGPVILDAHTSGDRLGAGPEGTTG